MKTVSLKLPDELYAKLVRLSHQRSVAKSEVVRDALQTYFRKPAGSADVSCADLAGDLVGCLAGPADLATDPKHLRGYGK